MNQLTWDQVVHILGSDAEDDRTVMSILDTAATEEELSEAYNLFIRGGDFAAELKHRPSGKVREIRDLLLEMSANNDNEATSGRL